MNKRRIEIMIITLIISASMLFSACGTANTNEKEESTTEKIEFVDGSIIWDGESVVVYDGEEAKIELFKSRQTVSSGVGTIGVAVQNKCEKPIGVNIDNVTIDYVIESSASATCVDIGIGDVCYETLELSDDMWMANLQTVSTLDFQIDIYDSETDEFFVENEKVYVGVTNMLETSLNVIPIRGAYTENQIVVENDEIRVVVEYLGNLENYIYNSENFTLMYYVENLSDKDISFECTGIAINGTTMDAYGSATISPEARWYGETTMSGSDLDENGIESIYSVDMCVLVNGDMYQDSGEWYPVNLLQQASKEKVDVKDGDVIYDKDGIKVIYLYTEEKHYEWSDETNQYWKFYIINESEHSIGIDLIDGESNGKKIDEDSASNSIYMMDSEVGAGQSRMAYIDVYDDSYEEFPTEMKFRLFIVDTYTNEVIDKTDEMCVVTRKIKQEETKDAN